MKRRTGTATTLAALVSIGMLGTLEVAAEVTVYPIDRSHSILDVTVVFGGFTEVRGNFDRWEGAIAFDPEDLTGSSVTVIVQTASIDTGVDRRDEHLRSADFFDAANQPLAIFRSHAIRESGPGYLVIGELSLHGISKEIAIPFSVVSAPALDPWGNRRVTFTGDVTLDRKSFDIVGPKFWNQAISDQVSLHIVASGRIYNYDHWNFDSEQKPSVGEAIWKAAEEQGAAAALALCDELSADRDAYNFAVDEISLVGLRLLQRDRPEEAVELFERALAEAGEEKQEASLRTHLGTALYQAGRRQEAGAAFERVLELSPNCTYCMEMLRHLRSPAAQ